MLKMQQQRCRLWSTAAEMQETLTPQPTRRMMPTWAEWAQEMFDTPQNIRVVQRTAIRRPGVALVHAGELLEWITLHGTWWCVKKVKTTTRRMATT